MCCVRGCAYESEKLAQAMEYFKSVDAGGFEWNLFVRVCESVCMCVRVCL